MDRIVTAAIAVALFTASAIVGALGAQLLRPADEPAAATPTPVVVESSPVVAETAVADAAPIATDVAVETPEPEATVETAPPVAPAPPENPEPAGPSDEEIVERFVAAFGTAHGRGDVAHLLETIHPAIPHAFGSSTCRTYVEATAGSIEQMTVVSVGERHRFTLPGPEGALTFEDAIPVEATWVVSHSGEAQTITFHLAPIAGTDQVGWLTQCGVKVKTA